MPLTHQDLTNTGWKEHYFYFQGKKSTGLPHAERCEYYTRNNFTLFWDEERHMIQVIARDIRQFLFNIPDPHMLRMNVPCSTRAELDMINALLDHWETKAALAEAIKESKKADIKVC